MPQVFRIDQGYGRLTHARVDHNGTLLVTGALARTGVQTYVHRDGSVTHELRHPDDVFDSRAMASLIEVPVTDDHPAAGRVTPDTARQLAVGNVGDTVRRSAPTGNLVMAELNIRDAATIKKIMGTGPGQPGKRELSVGYSADVTDEAGEYEGQRYDHRQTNIRANHVAVVARGRAGNARLLLDDATALRTDLSPEQEKALSAKIKLLAEEHPDWENDRRAAAAYSILGFDKKDEDDLDDDDEPGEDDLDDDLVIGRTSSEEPIYHTVEGHDYSSYGVEDHREAMWCVRRHHDQLVSLLAFAQKAAQPDALQDALKGEIAETRAAYKFHKGQAMVLDSGGEGSRGGQLRKKLDSSSPQTVRLVLNPIRLDAGGEGSRGGKVIGRTKSGKPVYASGGTFGHIHPENQDMLPNEHAEASAFHSTEAKRYKPDDVDKATGHGMRQEHLGMAKWHANQAAGKLRGAPNLLQTFTGLPKEAFQKK